MKKSNLFLTRLSLIFCTSFFMLFSCTNDSESKENEVVSAMSAYRTTSELPANSANIYDVYGSIQYDLLLAYYQTEAQPVALLAIANRIDSIANSNSDFQGVKDAGYERPNLTRIEYILSTKITCATGIISGMPISIQAKSSLSNFVSAVLDFSNHEEDYAVIYDYIVSYESEVMKDSLLDSNDQKILLTVSSIARYATYAKKKRPKKNMDPDWDVLVSCILSSAEGANFGAAEAIVYGLVAGVAENL